MNWTVLRNTKGKHICEEFFTILNHKGNPNQNSTEILSHPSQNGYQIKTKNNKFWQGCMLGRGNPYMLLMEM
jgi:hypothetical protein